MEHTMNKRTRGFTLIELMIVVAIIAILALIAYPTYTRQIQKSRRAQAKADITEIAQSLERQYTANRKYSGFTLPFAVSPRDSTPTAYNLSVDLADKTYKLHAVPAGPQATDACGELTLDQLGVKKHATGTDDNCTWGTVP
jgi:type IV pilus assembly protein PilE